MVHDFVRVRKEEGKGNIGWIPMFNFREKERPSAQQPSFHLTFPLQLWPLER